jgi:hypothetical protein
MGSKATERLCLRRVRKGRPGQAPGGDLSGAPRSQASRVRRMGSTSLRGLTCRVAGEGG